MDTKAQSTSVELTIDDKKVVVDTNTTVFNAAKMAGIFIPHYCYHPDLSIAGCCRMCVVEIEKQPKPVISCNTVVAPSMVVRTNTPKVKQTVKSALELHLINHPIDCPICDKAGECSLQNFYADYGLYLSQMRFEKVHKPKVVDLGPIVLDAERCILCSRCTRFTSEITKTHELGIFYRGDRSEVRIWDNGLLRNDYTGNLADVCPVGALTAKDFRFKCRVWFLERTPSICTLCAHGCNTMVSVNPKTEKLYRIEPRRNTHVNQSWMCDRGRWGFHYVESNTRISSPKRRGSKSGLEDISWHEVFGTLSDILQSAPSETVIALSTALTNEEIAHAVVAFRKLGIEQFMRVADENEVNNRKPYDGILKHRDETPNAAGFEKVMKILSVAWLTYDKARRLFETKKVSLTCVFGLETESVAGFDALIRLLPEHSKLLVHATNFLPGFERADWVLPNTSSFEKSGTMVNAAGRLQRLKASIPAQAMSRDMHRVILGIQNGHDRESLPTDTSERLFVESLASHFGYKSFVRWDDISPLGEDIASLQTT